MTNKTEPLSQEFTLPFVGREEELQFLLNEYDQMLHAQYRSVWIEAPAGMGKTTLVEEFLKRIDVVPHSGTTSMLKPWVVHAHLRERSSNSLASFVEALGATLQTLTEQQREKLFSRLTPFYQERARRIVGGGEVQSMGMEEAITASGYILKQLSKYFPLIVIIEDIHVLKGEMPFYALRHLQAIIEHVPLLIFFISRPSEEKNLIQFRGQIIKEGCIRCEVTSLKYEDIRQLSAKADENEIKELMRVSGGNALLLRELLKRDEIDSPVSQTSATETIIHYLTKDLKKLPKKDMEVLSVAGMLGEEFSEQLLREITENNNFKCWSDDVLHRLELRGIIRRGKKILKGGGEGKDVSMKVSVFSHALWWEAARKHYQKERMWADRKFAKTIVPLLSHEDYPLLTNAELISNLFSWLTGEKVKKLLIYVDGFLNPDTQWNFHSSEETAVIVGEAHRHIVFLVKNKLSQLDYKTKRAMMSLLNVEMVIHVMKHNNEKIIFQNDRLIRRLAEVSYKSQRDAIPVEVNRLFDSGFVYLFRYADDSQLRKGLQELVLIEKIARQYHPSLQVVIDVYRNAMRGGIMWFSAPQRAWQYLHRALAIMIGKEFTEEFKMFDLMAPLLLVIAPLLAIDQKSLKKCEKLLHEFECKNYQFNIYGRRRLILARLELARRLGSIKETEKLMNDVQKFLSKIPRINDRFALLLSIYSLYAYEYDQIKFGQSVGRLLSREFSWLDEQRRVKRIMRGVFFMEDWDLFEMLWKKNKAKLFPLEMRQLVGILEARQFMTLLLGRDEDFDEVKTIVTVLIEKYPGIQKTIKIVQNRINLFLSLRSKPLRTCKKNFDNFLAADKTLSPFDVAHYLYLFARIGVRYGHNPKEFSQYVKKSLEGFIKLRLPKRVVFTAEKFAEVNLISQKEYQAILKKFQKEEAVKQRIVIPDERNLVDEEEYDSAEKKIHLRCLGKISAHDPTGKEIVSRWWGKRKSVPSFYKQIILALVCAKENMGTVSRKELLAALFPEVARGASAKRIAHCESKLSVYLSHLKKGFQPYEIFQKTNDGYSLHPSVSVDVFEIENSLKKARGLVHSHPPSAHYLLLGVMKRMSKASFADGFHGKEISLMRNKVQQIEQDSNALLQKLTKAPAL